MVDIGYRSFRSALKFAPCKSSLPQVSCDSVCDEVLAAPSTRLVCLQGPLGCGKSTVMAQLQERYNQMGIATGWLSLDRLDNNLALFVANLARAVEAIFNRSAQEPSLYHQVNEENPGGLALELLDRLTAHPSPFVLFIDDLDKVDNASVAEVLEEIISHIPRGSQVVISSQASNQKTPDAFEKLRSQGKVLDIHERSLTFSLDAAEKLLEQGYAIKPKGNQLRLIHRVTAGSPLLIQLYALAVSAGADAQALLDRLSMPGGNAFHELMKEVLSVQEPTVTQLMESVSILDTFSNEILHSLGDDFASLPIDQYVQPAERSLLHWQGNACCYHEACAEYLRQRLKTKNNTLYASLYLQASSLFESLGYVVDAIDYAQHIDDKNRFFALISDHSDRLLAASHMQLVQVWLQADYDNGALEALPALMVAYAWALLFCDGLKAKPVIAHIEKTLPDDPFVQANLTALKPTLAALTDDFKDVQGTQSQLLTLLQQNYRFPASAMTLSLSAIKNVAGNLDEVHNMVESIRALPSYSPTFETLFDDTIAISELLAGNLNSAIERLRSVVDPREGTTYKSANGVALGGLLLAEAMYENDHRELAERLLGIYLPLVKRVVWPGSTLRAMCIQGRIAESYGKPEQALDVFTDIEYAGRQQQLPEYILTARLERARLLLARGDVIAAGEELDAMANDVCNPRATSIETLSMARLRYWIRTERTKEAVAPLQDLLQDAEDNQLNRRALSIRLLVAEATWRNGDYKDIKTYLEPALEMALEEGYIRPFLDEGEALIGMFTEYIRQPRVKVAYKRLVQGFLGTLCAPDSEKTAGDQDKLLTKKELQVVRLLAEGLSNPDIATRLIVAETTVRTHLRNINLKLGVNNRTAAVAEARRLNLIP
ncbi:hypothetical protein R50073_19310 [Maricurvus nonylphenolicus]|uniref:LuxR C-terminal-related transcriptional regulator n=1 Tax=Maricurvus nonylphenolicus TaxID=1008307 RepID=UPI0036F3DE1D